MADKTMYAWSPINNGKKVIKVGEAVTKADVGDDWDYLIEARAIRTDKYPETETGESPREYFLRQAAEAVESGPTAGVKEEKE